MSEVSLRRNIEIELTLQEQLEIFRLFVIKNPEAAKVAFNNPRGNCPFPSDCKSFPCDRLSCRADVCDNGYCYKMS